MYPKEVRSSSQSKASLLMFFILLTSRQSQHKIVSNSAYDKDVKVPAVLNLPPGQLFFGFNVVPYTPPQKPSSDLNGSPPVCLSNPVITFIDIIYDQITFGGTGHSVDGRAVPQASNATSSPTGRSEDQSTSHNWGTSGQVLSSRSSVAMKQVSQGAGKVAPRSSPQKNPKSKQRERSPSPDWGVDDDEIIMIDSD